MVNDFFENRYVKFKCISFMNLRNHNIDKIEQRTWKCVVWRYKMRSEVCEGWGKSLTFSSEQYCFNKAIFDVTEHSNRDS